MMRYDHCRKHKILKLKVYDSNILNRSFDYTICESNRSSYFETTRSFRWKYTIIKLKVYDQGDLALSQDSRLKVRATASSSSQSHARQLESLETEKLISDCILQSMKCQVWKTDPIMTIELLHFIYLFQRYQSRY